MSVRGGHRNHHSQHKHHGNHGLKPPIIREEDVFASNHLVSFSWKDPVLQNALYAGLPPMSPKPGLSQRGLLAKRAGGRKIIPKVPQSLHCLGCLKKEIAGQMSINDISTAWLQGHILPTEQQMKDKCVFYTGVKNSNRKGQSWLKAGDGLSARASDWACSNGLYSLWVSSCADHGFRSFADESRLYTQAETRMLRQTRCPKVYERETFGRLILPDHGSTISRSHRHDSPISRTCRVRWRICVRAKSSSCLSNLRILDLMVLIRIQAITTSSVSGILSSL
jgi:hypothetical protein